ncbi:MAG: hypothetical protein AAB437_04950 [Patescibacteria group bacterium]
MIEFKVYMIPLLIISNDSKSIQDYVEKLKVGTLFFEITPVTKEYSISDIKSIIKETKVFYPKIRNYFLPDFHLSSIAAQNSFLKLLEEPPSNVQFILSTDNKNRLLPTIISRVKIIKLTGNYSQNVVGAQFMINHTTTKIPLIPFKITDKESANNILLQIIIFFRGKLKTDKNSPVVIKEILRLKRLLESNNLNPQLTVDQGLIFIWKKYKIKFEDRR